MPQLCYLAVLVMEFKGNRYECESQRNELVELAWKDVWQNGEGAEGECRSLAGRGCIDQICSVRQVVQMFCDRVACYLGFAVVS